MEKKVIIIGGGVSGITTALTLQLLGYNTEIYSDKLAHQAQDKQSNPKFASLYPSASIIPHSVYSDELEELFRSSQSFFYELRKRSFPGLTIHKHFEVFEFKSEQPQYCDWMPNFKFIDELNPEEIPRRQQSRNLHGWVFDCIFADWSLYLPALARFYEKMGGTFIQKKLEHSDLDKLPTEIIINCSGTGSPELFDDPSTVQLLMRGHLIHKPEAPLLTNSNNEIISYNYTPGATTYADGDGNACDVYYYPRKDGWVLGGSRQTMTFEKVGNEDEFAKEETYNVNGIAFPKQIIDLNKEVLETTFGQTLGKPETLTPTVGYRYIRNRDNGLRLDQEEVSGKKVYHNYGLGGAGVTLSWGCALDIAERITSQSGKELKSMLINNISDTELASS